MSREADSHSIKCTYYNNNFPQSFGCSNINLFVEKFKKYLDELSKKDNDNAYYKHLKSRYDMDKTYELDDICEIRVAQDIDLVSKEKQRKYKKEYEEGDFEHYMQTTTKYDIPIFPTYPKNLKKLEIKRTWLHKKELDNLPDSLETLILYTSTINKLPDKLPTSLKELYCNGLELNTLPELPESLEKLSLINFYSYRFKFSTLPKSLKELTIKNTSIKNLPDLPEGLIILNCINCSIKEFPELPSGLKEFNCRMNPFDTLPKLPEKLSSLNCSFNALTTFPDKLPKSLEILNCENCNLKELPENLPTQKLKILRCCYNRFKKLPISIIDCIHLEQFYFKNDIGHDTYTSQEEAEEYEIELNIQQYNFINTFHNNRRTLVDVDNKTQKISDYIMNILIYRSIKILMNDTF